MPTSSDNNNENPYRAPPPGLLGEVAKFIYDAAPMPIPEVALAGAIGSLSGVCGRAFNVSGTGLNQYVLLIAPTGVGKEGARGGNRKLMKAIRPTVPSAADFYGPSFASAQALRKRLSRTPCFVSHMGEFGYKLQTMTKANAPQYLLEMRALILDLYNQSGASDELDAMEYANAEKNAQAVERPAFSILAETTPDTFNSALNEMTIRDGLVPRFITLEYPGEAPRRNKNALLQPSPELTERWGGFCAHALSLNNQQKIVHVGYDAEGEAELDRYDEWNREQREGKNEVTRGIRSRSHMNALKLSALAGVGCNPYQPTITQDIARWAISIVDTGARSLLARFNDGDNADANGEEVRLKKLAEAFIAFYQADYSALVNYDVRHDMHQHGLVPMTYLHRRLCNTKPFRKTGYLEPTELLKRAIRTLMERGEVQHVSQSELSKEYGYSGVAYASPRLLKVARKLPK